VAEPAGARWSLARYGAAARHLGRFNGAYLVGRPLPDAPWLCRDLLRWRTALAAPFWDRLAERRDDPRVRRGWPGEVADRGHRVWAERARLLAALDGLPQVLCHGDAERRNLFARDADGGTETVAIDWACTGPRAVGAEAATLVAQSVLWARDRDPTELPALARRCYGGYLAGLREAGWAGEERMVRLGFAAVAALQFVALTGVAFVGTTGDAERPRYEAAFGATLEAILDRHAAMQPFLLDLADEARHLLDARP
jgi:Ser/Thr protein kinase RdoA (MazF antagonist)